MGKNYKIYTSMHIKLCKTIVSLIKIANEQINSNIEKKNLINLTLFDYRIIVFG